jgi:hypothetical protein
LTDPEGLKFSSPDDAHKMTCAELMAQIEERLADLEKRVEDFQEDKYGLGPNDPGHVDIFKSRQAQLLAFIEEYASRCGPPPCSWTDSATQEVPQPNGPSKCCKFDPDAAAAFAKLVAALMAAYASISQYAAQSGL